LLQCQGKRGRCSRAADHSIHCRAVCSRRGYADRQASDDPGVARTRHRFRLRCRSRVFCGGRWAQGSRRAARR